MEIYMFRVLLEFYLPENSDSERNITCYFFLLTNRYKENLKLRNIETNATIQFLLNKSIENDRYINSKWPRVRFFFSFLDKQMKEAKKKKKSG